MNDLFSCVSLVDLPVKMLSQLAGFEPTRAEPIGFQVQRLNHSATTARHSFGHLSTQNSLEMRGIEPRAFHMQSERSTTELHPHMYMGSRVSIQQSLDKEAPCIQEKLA